MINGSLVIDHLQKVDFKEAKIVPGDEKSPFYLDIIYTIENLYGIHELHIPRINMSGYFLRDEIPNIIHDEEYSNNMGMGKTIYFLKPRCTCSPNFILSEFNCGLLSMEDDPHLKMDGRGFEIKTIKEKEREMTIDEIEKELGYKVKIVTK